MKQRYVSYLRVSTGKQEISGLGIEAQRQNIARFVSDGALIREFVEVESGRFSDRPELHKALALCRLQGATLLVAKLDRLSRNVAFMAALMEAGVEFKALDVDTANRFTVHIHVAVAEQECRLISERTKAALAAAKARGVRLGGVRPGHEVSRHARAGAAASARSRSAKADSWAKDLAPEIADVRREIGSDATLREVAKALTARGFKSPRGYAMKAATVARIEARAA